MCAAIPAFPIPLLVYAFGVVNGQRVGDPILPSSRLNFVQYLPYRLGGSSYVSDPYITVKSKPDRNALNDSFYFRLPDAWSPQVI